MRKIVISQPMYFPWRGLFEQIKLCDVFVFYDNVPLPLGTHKTFITRVQIKTERGWEWLSVPIKRAGHEHQLIKDACFHDSKWKRSHLTKLKQAYKTAHFFSEIDDLLINQLYQYDTESFSQFCIYSTRLVCDYLGLNKEFYIASESNTPETENPSERVLNICKSFDATEHIAGHGIKNYLDHELFEKHNIITKYINLPLILNYMESLTLMYPY